MSAALANDSELESVRAEVRAFIDAHSPKSLKRKDGPTYSETELNATRNWLSGKAQPIYGGSNEIQSNIIAKRILGLLDHQ
ncbi:MAG: hypothetical protein WDM91_17610 [Rhizomicrobium sp.]